MLAIFIFISFNTIFLDCLYQNYNSDRAQAPRGLGSDSHQARGDRAQAPRGLGLRGKSQRFRELCRTSDEGAASGELQDPGDPGLNPGQQQQLHKAGC